MTASTGEQVAVLLLRASWSALRDEDAPNDLPLADNLLAGLEREEALDAIGFLTRAFVIVAEQSPDLDVDRLLGFLGLSVAAKAAAA